jgi:hypothetical protein
MWEDMGQQVNDFWLPLQKYGELDRNEIFSHL